MIKCNDLIEDVKNALGPSASSSTFIDEMWSIQTSMTFQTDEPIPPDHDLCHRCCKTERGKHLLESRWVQLEMASLWTQSHWSRSPYCSASPTEENISSDCINRDTVWTCECKTAAILSEKQSSKQKLQRQAQKTQLSNWEQFIWLHFVDRKHNSKVTKSYKQLCI